MEDTQNTTTPQSPPTGPASVEHQHSPPAQAHPAQAQLPLHPTATRSDSASASKSEPGMAPKDMAKLMADNRLMSARLKEFEATQGKDARERQEAQAMADAERHNAELSAATSTAEKAMASARRNAVKAHFRGALKADTYLALVPQVGFTDEGDLTAESVAALDEFRKEHLELFTTPSTATTPMSASGAGDSADAMNPEHAAALRLNRIPLPGDAKHWSNRSGASTMSAFVGHNMEKMPWKASN